LTFPKRHDDKCANQVRGGGGMDINWPASSCSQSVYEYINAVDGSKVVKISSRKVYS